MLAMGKYAAFGETNRGPWVPVDVGMGSILDNLMFNEQATGNDRPYIWWISTDALYKSSPRTVGCHPDGSGKPIVDRTVVLQSSVKVVIPSAGGGRIFPSTKSPNQTFMSRCSIHLNSSSSKRAARAVQEVQKTSHSMGSGYTRSEKTQERVFLFF